MAKFYLGSVIIVLNDLHKAGIAYRNLKAENVLIDDKGYVKMTGFGWAKRLPYHDGTHMKIRTHTLCGTPEYMAPEIIMQTGHNTSVGTYIACCIPPFVYIFRLRLSSNCLSNYDSSRPLIAYSSYYLNEPSRHPS